ncbi:helix-turn-helix transcriptional regulator [Tessaracoccus sp. HDW20]|uniref:helix-turn-helix domain-containing protein n=1 Tax=Tessaracoccus coleopterorum TaxID=2714950 RepID=UPI0018D3E2C9|nr:helix-turn-helix domain-containing protein [Tessaracoccus coleopterorum]NHB84613.1 helix-turn-helix transcriptional regulator [Tessaracoccus coleopterorum]
MLAFITNTCSVHDLSAAAARAIAPAAEQVVRSLLVAALGTRTQAEPLFMRARRYILQHFTDPGLRIEQVALHLGVSVRTVQAELKEGDTSFSRLLLEARAQAALGILAEHPGIARADLARRSGFGSLSSLQRALRTA